MILLSKKRQGIGTYGKISAHLHGTQLIDKAEFNILLQTPHKLMDWNIHATQRNQHSRNHDDGHAQRSYYFTRLFFSVVSTKEGVVCFIKQAQMKHINCNKGFNVILCLLKCLFNDYSV